MESTRRTQLETKQLSSFLITHTTEGLHFLNSVAIMATDWVQSRVLCAGSSGQVSQAQWPALHTEPRHVTLEANCTMLL